MEDPNCRLPSCGWYFAKYDAKYWRGAPFNVLSMMRDADDKGKPNDNDVMPGLISRRMGYLTPTSHCSPT